GAILRRSDNVISGLTTAATLWIVAAIGLSVGSGFYVPAVVTTVIVLLSTLLLNKFETRFMAFKRSGSLRISMLTEDRLSSLNQITSRLEKSKMKIERVHVTDQSGDDGERQVMLEFQVYAVNGRQFNQLFESLWEVEDVRDIRMN